MEITKEKKEAIEKQIVDTCIGGLENKSLTEDQMGDISFFVLERIDLVKTQEELVEFLKKLSERWQSFKGMYEIERGQMDVAEEKQKIENVERFIKNGDIDAALSAARTATEKKEEPVVTG